MPTDHRILPAPPERIAPLPQLARVIAASFLAQVVQIGTVPALFALRLDAAGSAPTVIGAVAAAPWIAIVVLGRWVPRCIARLGCRGATAAGLGLSALAVGGALLAPAAAAMFALNFLFGFGLILRWIACDTWIVALAPPTIRGRAIGVHETLMGCGIAAAPCVLAAAGMEGAAPLLASMALFALSGACLLPRGSDRSGVEGTRPGAARVADAFPGAEEEDGLAGALRALPSAIAAGFAGGFAETSCISFLPVFASRGELGADAALALGTFGLGGTLLQVPLGWLADRFGHRCVQGACGVLVIAGVCALATAARSDALLPTLFILGAAAGGMYTLAVIDAGRIEHGHSVASAMAAVAVAYAVGAICGPLLAGYANASGALPGFALAIGAGAGALPIGFALRGRPRPRNAGEGR